MAAGSHRLRLASGFALADAFVAQARGAATMAALGGLMEDVSREMGFRHYAIIHHADLREDRPGLINLQNYPAIWADQFVQQRLYIEDPIVHACLRADSGFCWSEISRFIRMNPRYRAILERAASEGLADGITVPTCVLGECTGSCTLAAPRSPRVLERYLGVAQIVGVFGFQAARRLVSGGSVSLPARPRLHPRQRDCVALVGLGKSNWEIGTILGLSPVTVGHYLTDARSRYDVTTRTQLVVCAILNGEVSLAELVAGQYVRSLG